MVRYRSLAVFFVWSVSLVVVLLCSFEKLNIFVAGEKAHAWAAEGKFEGEYEGINNDCKKNDGIVDCPYDIKGNELQETSAVPENEEERRLKDLKYPKNIFGVVLIILGSIIAVAAGAGGGSIYVSVLTLIMGFNTHEAAIASQSLMCGAVLAGCIVNARNCHPYADRALIDVDLSLFLGPIQMAGVSLGIVINRCLPEWLIVLLLVVALGYSLLKTSKHFRKAVAARQVRISEANAEAALRAQDDSAILKPDACPADGDSGVMKMHAVVQTPYCDGCVNAEEQRHVVALELGENDSACGSTGGGRQGHNASSSSCRFVEQAAATERPTSCGAGEGVSPATEVQDHVTAAQNSKIGGTKKREEQSVKDAKIQVCGKRMCPIKCGCFKASADAVGPGGCKMGNRNAKKWFVMFSIWSFDVTVGVIRGSKRSVVDLVPYCGWEYWFLFGGAGVVLLSTGYISGLLLIKKQKVKDARNIQPVKGDVHFDYKISNLFFLQTLVSGVIAGVIGIGGSMLLSPIMLSRGMLPPVIAALNTFLILVSSSSAAIKSIMGGDVPWDYCIVLFCVCFACALIGKEVVDKYVKKHDAPHILICFLILMMVASSCCIVATGIIGLIEGRPRGFQGPC